MFVIFTSLYQFGNFLVKPVILPNFSLYQLEICFGQFYGKTWLKIYNKVSNLTNYVFSKYTKVDKIICNKFSNKRWKQQKCIRINLNNLNLKRISRNVSNDFTIAIGIKITKMCSFNQTSSLHNKKAVVNR